MTTLIPQWHGTDIELVQLKDAANRNCRSHENLACDEHCPHRLLGDQRLMNRLVFARRLSDRLWHEETDAISEPK